MKKKIVSAAFCSAIVVGFGTAIISLLPLPTTVSAADAPTVTTPSPPASQWHEGREKLMAAKLGLSGEQQLQIEAIREEEEGTIAPLRQQLRASQDQMRALGKAEPFDEAAVREFAATLEPTRTELLVAHTRVMSRIRSVLTPEQREKADIMETEGGKWRAGRPGNHGHHGPEVLPPDSDQPL